MLTREPGELESILRGAHAVAAHQFEQRRMLLSERERADMGDGRRAASAAPSTRDSARSTSPSGHKAIARADHCGDAGVMPEAKGQIVVAAGLEQGERAFKMFPRFAYSPANQ